MMVYPERESSIRPRKPTKDMFRKNNYWSHGNQEPTPWYVWDTKGPITKAKGDERNPPKNAKMREEDSTLAKDLREYLMTSTLHGLRYIGEKKLTWFERFFWLTAFGCSLICATYFILNVYTKWRSSPMIVSINPRNMDLQELPFPALTICNVNQAEKSVAERYMKSGDLVDKKLLQSLCATKNDSEIFENDIANTADWDHTRSFLINVTQPCNQMIVKCDWDSETMRCDDLFNAQLTDEGLCCTFNVVHRKMLFRDPKSLNDLNITFPSPAVDWTPENGYPSDAPADGFPWRPKDPPSSCRAACTVYETQKIDVTTTKPICESVVLPQVGLACSIMMRQFNFSYVLLHNPTETPKIRNLGEIYGPGMEARVAIWPRILDAQPTLRTIDVKKRLCLFSSETKLVFYRTYTLKNCEMECEARAMLDTCNCVHYYMPKNKTTRVCGKADARCYSNMSQMMPDGRDASCAECLPACTEISYTERLSTAPLKIALVDQLARSLDNRTPEYFIENMLIMHFFFEDNTFMRFTKGEIFGLTEFLSNTGGLLGLCMGFSMMSAVELLYFTTLRAFCMARHRRPKQPFVK